MTTESITAVEPTPDLSPGRALRARMLAHKGLCIGLAIIVAGILLALLAPLIAPHDPYAQDLARRLLPPVWDARGTWQNLLGTDHLGRDYLSRLLYGSRISIVIGVAAASIGCLIGVTLGMCAGYFGGRVDEAVSYLLTCQLALPSLLLAMSLVFLIGPSLFVVIGVIGVLHWTYFLVVTRAATMQIRQLDYISAARALGSSRWQVMTHEILPNTLDDVPLVVEKAGYRLQQRLQANALITLPHQLPIGKAELSRCRSHIARLFLLLDASARSRFSALMYRGAAWCSRSCRARPLSRLR